jgi:ketosteroid isomerase-like protein
VRVIIDITCIWITPAGICKGRQEIADFFTLVADKLDFHDLVPHETIEQGETIVVICTAFFQVKKTGRTVEEGLVHIIKYNEGRMVYFKEYTDTPPFDLQMT